MATYTTPPRTGREAFEMMPEGTLCQVVNDTLIMSPVPATTHARVQNRIVKDYDYVEETSLGEVFCAPVDVYFNNKNIFQPDIVFVSTEKKGLIKRGGIFGAPDLIIEILSEDKSSDLMKKKSVYEQAGVQEYWVVDPKTKWCEGYRLINKASISSSEGYGQLVIHLLAFTLTF